MGLRRAHASRVRSSEDRGGSMPEEGNSSPGFLPPLIAAGRRNNMSSPAANPRSSTSGSVAAQALQALMLYSGGGEKNGFGMRSPSSTFQSDATTSQRKPQDYGGKLWTRPSRWLCLFKAPRHWPSARSPSLCSSRGYSFVLYKTDAREASRQHHSRGDATC